MSGTGPFLVRAHRSSGNTSTRWALAGATGCLPKLIDFFRFYFMHGRHSGRCQSRYRTIVLALAVITLNSLCNSLLAILATVNRPLGDTAFASCVGALSSFFHETPFALCVRGRRICALQPAGLNILKENEKKPVLIAHFKCPVVETGAAHVHLAALWQRCYCP